MLPLAVLLHVVASLNQCYLVTFINPYIYTVAQSAPRIATLAVLLELLHVYAFLPFSWHAAHDW